MSIEYTGGQLVGSDKKVVIKRTGPLELLLPEVNDFPCVDFRFFSLYSAAPLPAGAEIFGPYENDCHLRVSYDNANRTFSLEKIPPLEYPAAPIVRPLQDEEKPSLLNYLRRLIKLSQWPLSDQDRQVVELLSARLQEDVNLLEAL